MRFNNRWTLLFLFGLVLWKEWTSASDCKSVVVALCSLIHQMIPSIFYFQVFFCLAFFIIITPQKPTEPPPPVWALNVVCLLEVYQSREGNSIWRWVSSALTSIIPNISVVNYITVSSRQTPPHTYNFQDSYSLIFMSHIYSLGWWFEPETIPSPELSCGAVLIAVSWSPHLPVIRKELVSNNHAWFFDPSHPLSCFSIPFHFRFTVHF